MTNDALDPAAFSSDQAGALQSALLQLDVAGMAQELVTKVVVSELRSAITAVIKPIVAQTIEAALTPEVVDELARQATVVATNELAPDPAEVVDESAPEPPPELCYASLDDFVRNYIVPTFRRGASSLEGNKWAAEWWASDEAHIRLEALWRSFEALRLDPGLGMSVWLRDHLDHHLPILLSASTGIYTDSSDDSKVAEPLPYTAPPPGMFPDVRQQPPAAPQSAPATNAVRSGAAAPTGSSAPVVSPGRGRT